MAKTIENDSQGDLFGRGTEITEYVPCVEPPVAEMDEQFFASQYMDLYRAIRSGELSPQEATAAKNILDSLTKVTKVAPAKGNVTVNTGGGDVKGAQAAIINFVGVKPKDASNQP
jgi:hypothetical protein